MKTVCIESPLAGDIIRNLDYARAALRFVLEKGHAPFASHLLYTQVLDDLRPMHREIGIAAGLALGDQCDERWFFLDFGMSGGMERALLRAKEEGQPISEWHLGPDWRHLHALNPTPGMG